MGIGRRVGENRVPNRTAIERVVADEGEQRYGEVAPGADKHTDLGRNRGAVIRHHAGDHDYLGHTPEAQLFAESEDAAALRDFFCHQHHDLQQRPNPGEEQREEKEAEREGEPHLAVDDGDAGDEETLAEDEVLDRRVHQRQKHGRGQQREDADRACETEQKSSFRSPREKSIAAMTLRESAGRQRRDGLRFAAVRACDGDRAIHESGASARGVPGEAGEGHGRVLSL